MYTCSVHLCATSTIAYCSPSFVSLCNIGMTNTTIGPFSSISFNFSSLHAIHRGVNFIISTSSANVISLSSSFNFNCFCKGGLSGWDLMVSYQHIPFSWGDYAVYLTRTWGVNQWELVGQHCLQRLVVRKTLKLKFLFFFIYFCPVEPKCNSKHSQSDCGNNNSHACKYSIVYMPVCACPCSTIKYSTIYVT